MRRRLRETHACRLIQQAFRVHRVWLRISLKLYARRVAGWYKRILDGRSRAERLRILILNRSASAIQRFCRGAMHVTRSASIHIQRAARGRMGRVHARTYKLQVGVTPSLLILTRHSLTL